MIYITPYTMAFAIGKVYAVIAILTFMEQLYREIKLYRDAHPK